jgi:DtxR family transcriptional regulator, Mn-dependent transcriptional regulator
MLSQAVEDYVKAIFKLQRRGPVATTDLAQALGVAPASATKMVKRLAGLGLADHQSYQGVTLTPAGERVALEVIRHHRLLELYLREVLGYSWKQLHEEAEHLEHHISEEFEERIDALLGHPTHDPHGHPIPTRDGQLAEHTAQSLVDVEPGRTAVVHYVCDADPEFLHYLEEVGLLPQSVVEVLDRRPFKGSLTVLTGDVRHIIDHEIAGRVFVVASD